VSLQERLQPWHPAPPSPCAALADVHLALAAFVVCVLAPSWQIGVFAFTFNQAGTYVFASSSNAAAQTVVVVQPLGRSCDVVDGPLTPMSSAALVVRPCLQRGL
jgi:hypothetical protein